MSDSKQKPFFDSPKNWVEDFPHDNGQYTCYCYSCGSNFIGYKRRVVCKECDIVLQENDKKLKAYDPLLSELEQLREENERLKQQADFNEEIKKQMQIRISDEMVRTFNRDQNITQLENLCRSKDMQIEKLMEEGKQSLLLYNSMTKNIEQLQEYIGHQEGHVNAIKEDRDNFAISFAVWAMHNTQAQAYQAAGISAYDLLEKYKSRPFIDTENAGNQ